jgi:transposase
MSYAVAMNKRVRPRRDFQALEQRRKEAVRYFEAGELSLAEIARELKVSRQSVSRWYAEWKRGGAAALRGAGRAGRKPRLQPEQLEQLDQAFRKGARAHGFQTDLWTLPRVATVLERLTGEHYHPGHVWKILKGMSWTLQRPATQSPEGDALAKAKANLADHKKTRRQKRLDLLPGRKQGSQRPSIRRTWAPRGKLPP